MRPGPHFGASASEWLLGPPGSPFNNHLSSGRTLPETSSRRWVFPLNFLDNRSIPSQRIDTGRSVQAPFPSSAGCRRAGHAVPRASGHGDGGDRRATHIGGRASAATVRPSSGVEPPTEERSFCKNGWSRGVPAGRRSRARGGRKGVVFLGGGNAEIFSQIGQRLHIPC